MAEIQALRSPIKEKTHLENFYNFILKFSSFIESLLILGFWVFIFMKSENFGGYSRNTLLTYLLTGNIIGFISSFFLHRFIRNDIRQRDQNLLTKYPFHYLKIILLRGFGRNIIPFLIVIALNALLLKIFTGGLDFSLEPIYILLLVIMMALAFIFEFLLAYLVRLLTFWIVTSKEIYVIIMRLKKIVAGNYFPLGLLSLAFLNFSYFLPFAYTFYIPTQLFLKQIPLQIAVRGVFIQIFWIGLLFFLIRYIVKKKIEKQAKSV